MQVSGIDGARQPDVIAFLTLMCTTGMEYLVSCRRALDVNLAHALGMSVLDRPSISL